MNIEPTPIHAPLALIAEITHRCPLHCVYCSNPLELQQRSTELSTTDWASVFAQAGDLGVWQVDLTGGEPLARPDLFDLIRSARFAGLYVNLITSGLPLDERRLDSLVAAGLDHFQLSFQSAREETAREISGTKSHAHKLRVLEWLKTRRLAVTLNFVLHRGNLGQVPEMLALAESSCATRVEFANVQYYGWAFANRGRLLPTHEQLRTFVEQMNSARKKLRGRIHVDYLVPDYYSRFPKPCMGGWGRKFILITPSGGALPCHAAHVIPGLSFENVKDRTLRDIWESSPAFQKFRGEGWMPEPCRSCDRRERDFGGCRCQAMLLAGDAAATDPVCSLSPQRPKVDAILLGINAPSAAESSARPGWLHRPNPL